MSEFQDDEPKKQKKKTKCWCNTYVMPLQPQMSLKYLQRQNFFKAFFLYYSISCLQSAPQYLWGSTGTGIWNNAIFPKGVKMCYSRARFQRVRCSDGASGCEELHHGKSWSFLCILRPTDLWCVHLVCHCAKFLKSLERLSCHTSWSSVRHH